jgi:hypothetical protein
MNSKRDFLAGLETPKDKPKRKFNRFPPANPALVLEGLAATFNPVCFGGRPFCHDNRRGDHEESAFIFPEAS